MWIKTVVMVKELVAHRMRPGPLINLGGMNPVCDLITWGLVTQSGGLPNFTLELLPSDQIPIHQPLSHWELETVDM